MRESVRHRRQLDKVSQILDELAGSPAESGNALAQDYAKELRALADEAIRLARRIPAIAETLG